MKRSDLTSIILDHILSNTLKGQHALYEGSPKEKIIKVQVSDDVFYQIAFDLTNQKPPYHFLEGIGIVHKNISKVIQDILANSNGDYGWRCSTGTHVRNYWPKNAAVTVGSVEEVERFILTYNEAFAAAKKDFLDRYIDLNTFIHDCTLFYTKWPKGMMPQNVGFSLIGFGILNKDKRYVLKGRELLIRKKAQLVGLPKRVHDAMDFMIAYTSDVSDSSASSEKLL